MIPDKNKFDPGKIRALALDLDGTTLLPDTSLGECTVKCLRRLIKNGMQVIFCTGRAIESSCRYYSAIGAKGPMVFFNGAEVADVPDVRLISSTLLDISVAAYGLELAREMGLHFQVFLPPNPDSGKNNKWEVLYIEKQRPESEMYQKHTGITPVISDLKTLTTSPSIKGCVKAMFIAEPPLLEEARQKMLARFGDTIYAARSFPTFLEILNSGVSKGKGLRTVMECRGLKPEEVMAFGDEENDLPMFEAAGFSAAPSNAKDKVRQSADFVFGSSTEEGLAAFLEEMFK